MLLYIHGFNSSPDSQKARDVRDYFETNFPEVILFIPELEFSVLDAMAQLTDIVEQAQKKQEKICYMGSSLGGYFATYLSENFGGKAVLINPAIKPYELLHAHLGDYENPYSKKKFSVTLEQLEYLKKYDVDVIRHPDRFLVLLQQGDELLDYRQAMWKFQGCQMSVEAGGDHAFQNLTKHFSRITEFFQLHQN